MTSKGCNPYNVHLSAVIHKIISVLPKTLSGKTSVERVNPFSDQSASQVFLLYSYVISRTKEYQCKGTVVWYAVLVPHFVVVCLVDSSFSTIMLFHYLLLKGQMKYTI